MASHVRGACSGARIAQVRRRQVCRAVHARLRLNPQRQLHSNAAACQGHRSLASGCDAICPTCSACAHVCVLLLDLTKHERETSRRHPSVDVVALVADAVRWMRKQISVKSIFVVVRLPVTDGDDIHYSEFEHSPHSSHSTYDTWLLDSESTPATSHCCSIQCVSLNVLAAISFTLLGYMAQQTAASMWC